MNTSLSKKQIDSGARNVFLLCVLAYTAIYIGRKNFSVCLSAILDENFIDKIAGGSAGTAFLIIYAVGQAVSGIISDRLSPKHMITIGLCGAGCANLLMAVNRFPALVTAIWCLCGAFCSMLWASIIKCIAEWLPDDRIEKAGVNISITVPLGSVITYVIASGAMKLAGWREVFAICGSICIISGLIFRLSVAHLSPYITFIADSKTTVEITGKKNGNKTAAKEKRLFAAMISVSMLLIVASVLCNGALKDGLDFWTPTFISEFFGISASVSAILMSFIPILNVAGAHFANFFFRFGLDEMSVTGIMYLIASGAFIPICLMTYYGSNSVPLMYLSIVLLAIIMLATTGANTALMTFIPLRYKNSGITSGISGILNAFSYAGAACSGIIGGFISQNNGWFTVILTFAGISMLGALVSFAGIHAWKKRRQSL